MKFPQKGDLTMELIKGCCERVLQFCGEYHTTLISALLFIHTGKVFSVSVGVGSTITLKGNSDIAINIYNGDLNVFSKRYLLGLTNKTHNLKVTDKNIPPLRRSFELFQEALI